MIDRAVEISLEAIEVCKRRIVMFNHAIQNIRRDASCENAIEIISARLYKDLNEAYANLFMWGNVVPKEAMKQARKAAFEYFLKENFSIMQYLDIDLKHPGSWLTEEEEEFRAEIEAAKAEENDVVQ